MKRQNDHRGPSSFQICLSSHRSSAHTLSSEGSTSSCRSAAACLLGRCLARRNWTIPSGSLPGSVNSPVVHLRLVPALWTFVYNLGIGSGGGPKRPDRSSRNDDLRKSLCSPNVWCPSARDRPGRQRSALPRTRRASESVQRSFARILGCLVETGRQAPSNSVDRSDCFLFSWPGRFQTAPEPTPSTTLALERWQ